MGSPDGMAVSHMPEGEDSGTLVRSKVAPTRGRCTYLEPLLWLRPHFE
ncbi:hypothetical protein AVV12_gp41 [Streptomyces phage SF3]|uniref:Uncharacterized protein n=1 Tax=Streptomyces phage SF3 TaxID=1690818 RepID=A0A0M4S2J1_9CAUD|nr:hypothetical protein AVV12_gp41 [Streptomyces phage SF3]ALF00172.1 hypothetical protein SF3_410 [Streptomyces phage SF3]